ncbi:MAG: DinB family protein [Anaerolineaceae bacterium]|nr:DinB family protein [Anaerolineaceae bacterium]MCB9100009.1 DinB family protein [Anaerolineales bacterium]
MADDKKAQLKSKLTEARNQLKELLNALSEEQLTTPVITDGNAWTPINVVSHLAENEQGMSIHIYKIRKGRETVPAGFDVNVWNAGVKERMGNPSRAELMVMLDEARAKTLEGLESIEPHEWSLTGRHPIEGITTIEQYFGIITSHDLDHIADIKKGLGVA